MIERYHLRYFLAVVDAGNFSRAAQQMSVTQPTLSIAIARLEEALGARLFFRNSKRVQLTESGARLLAHARTVESDFNALVDRVAEKGDQPLLRVGVLSSIPTRFIEQLVRGNADSPAPSALEIIEGTERDLHNRLARRRLDVALTLVRPGETGLPYEILFREGYAIAAPSNHPFAGLEAVSGEALRDDVM
ncbi:MAG: LysR family transcriptional regulator, partial [Dehalococcoidia bacterium]|nr:LysR family transcriptional regulator [Dehalococcoidia bacterium]